MFIKEIKYFVLFSKIICLYPHHLFKYNNTKQMNNKMNLLIKLFLNIIYIIILILILIYWYYQCLMFDQSLIDTYTDFVQEHLQYNHNVISNYSNQFQYYLQHCVTLVSIVCAFLKRKQYQKFFYNIYMIDKYYMKHIQRHHILNNKLKLYSLIFFILIICRLCILFAILFNWHRYFHLQLYSYVIGITFMDDLILNTVVCQFLGSLILLQQRFVIINDQIDDFINHFLWNSTTNKHHKHKNKKHQTALQIENYTKYIQKNKNKARNNHHQFTPDYEISK